MESDGESNNSDDDEDSIGEEIDRDQEAIELQEIMNISAREFEQQEELRRIAGV